MKKTFSFILAVIMLVGLFTGVVAAEEKTEFLFVNGAAESGDTGIVFWTGKTAGEFNIQVGKSYIMEFDAKGVTGQKAVYDFSDGSVGMGGDYTFTSEEWEHVVSAPMACTNNKADAHPDTGMSARVYTISESSFYVDNIVIYEVTGSEKVAVMEWKDITAVAGCPFGSWAANPDTFMAEIKDLTPDAPVEEPKDDEEPKEEPKEETKEEVLGANELTGASFDKASDANNWWFRADWNSKWEIKDGALVAIGSGADNNGAFYNTQGEGQEYSITLKKGETYVVSVKVFRPAGVDSDSYLDINEGALASLHAEKNGEWETLTARFVANDKPIKIRLVVNALAEGEKVMFDDVEIRMVGGDPDKASSSDNPSTSDNMVIGFVAAAMVVAVAGVAVVAKKRVLSK